MPLLTREMEREYGPLTEFDGQADLIWGTTARTFKTKSPDFWLVISERSGAYVWPVGMDLLSALSDEAKARLTTWIAERNALTMVPPILAPIQVQEALSTPGFTFQDRVDRFFNELAQRNFRIGHYVRPTSNIVTVETQAAEELWLRVLQLENKSQLHQFYRYLQDDDLISPVNNTNGLRLTANGFRRMEQSRTRQADTDRVFVAMWFDASMADIYDKGIKAGIEDAGWRPVRIDKVEHVNKIDDQIIAEIRRSRFMVADFTCADGFIDGEPAGIPRGGVYFEAGFAKALDMEVVWTVRKDHLNLVHFDNRQFNFIDWTDAADLRSRLRDRIVAVMGEYGQANASSR